MFRTFWMMRNVTLLSGACFVAVMLTVTATIAIIGFHRVYEIFMPAFIPTLAFLTVLVAAEILFWLGVIRE